MDHTTMLTDMLKLHLGWNLARIKCLACLIIALFKVKTVNFAELATAFSGSAKVESHYRLIQRFFKEVPINPEVLAQIVGFWVETVATSTRDSAWGPGIRERTRDLVARWKQVRM